MILAGKRAASYWSHRLSSSKQVSRRYGHRDASIGLASYRAAVAREGSVVDLGKRKTIVANAFGEPEDTRVFLVSIGGKGAREETIKIQWSARFFALCLFQLSHRCKAGSGR